MRNPSLALFYTPMLLLIASSASLTAQPKYEVFNLGNIGGTSSSGNTINNIGVSMGSANKPGDTTEQAAVWFLGLKTGLGTLGGPNSDIQWPVKNDFGLISGWAETSALDPLGETWSCTAFNPTRTPTGHTCVGFVWQFGVMTALPTLGGNNGFAAGVNNYGQIAGWAETTYRDPTCNNQKHQYLQFEPVVYGPGRGQIRQLATFPGDPDGAATAINDSGDVIGISGTCDVAVGALTAQHALLWHNGQITNLGNLGGKGWNTPMAINSRGDIVGFSDLPGDISGGVLTPNFHAFIWTQATHKMVDIGVLDGDTLSEALDINDLGQVVGISIPSFHGFIYENGKMTDLNKLVPNKSPLVVIEGGGINNFGEITGEGCVIVDGQCPLGNNTPAVLLVPKCNNCGDDDRDNSNDGNRNVVISDEVRQKVMQKLAFGHFEAQPVR